MTDYDAENDEDLRQQQDEATLERIEAQLDAYYEAIRPQSSKPRPSGN